MDLTKPTQEEAPAAILKHGQGLRALVEARRSELELELGEVLNGAPGNSADIQAALGALKALLTGNLDQISPAVAQELSHWMETSKYLGATQAVTKQTGGGPATIQDLRAYVEARRQEHELALSEIKTKAPDKSAEVETSLQALKALLAGDLDQIPPAVAQELAQCIETSKYLGSKARRAAQV